VSHSSQNPLHLQLSNGSFPEESIYFTANTTTLNGTMVADFLQSKIYYGDGGNNVIFSVSMGALNLETLFFGLISGAAEGSKISTRRVAIELV
jgi:hypothetical protein